MNTSVLGIGGLGDWSVSLLPWEEELTKLGTPYQFIDILVDGKTSFNYRVETLEEEVVCSNKPLLIIGQSAGALAALIVASKHPEKVTGVIAISPAMPRGISPLDWPLVSIMRKYQLRMWQHKLIKLSHEDYTKLALTGVVIHQKFLLDLKQPISGREATELLTPWLQPKLGKVNVPVVYIYGDQDQWVSPKAHKKFAARLRQANQKTKVIVAEGAGHLPAHSHDRHAITHEALSALVEMESISS